MGQFGCGNKWGHAFLQVSVRSISSHPSTDSERRFQYIVKDFDSITFHSNYTPESGSLDRSFGSLTFDRNPDSSQERPILKMDMQYSSVAVRDVTTVCVVEVDGEVGLTLYVSCLVFSWLALILVIGP